MQRVLLANPPFASSNSSRVMAGDHFESFAGPRALVHTRRSESRRRPGRAVDSGDRPSQNTVRQKCYNWQDSQARTPPFERSRVALSAKFILRRLFTTPY